MYRFVEDKGRGYSLPSGDAGDELTTKKKSHQNYNLFITLYNLILGVHQNFWACTAPPAM